MSYSQLLKQSKSDFNDVVNSCGYVPLSWSSSNDKCPFFNLGDALSPVIVTTISGIDCKHCGFESDKYRLAAIGSIGQRLKLGKSWIWGTGFDPIVTHPDQSQTPYFKSDDTLLFPMATRGPTSRQTLLNCSVEVPDIYGDPAWFIPFIFPRRVEPKYELGIILHLSELARNSPPCVPLDKFTRYQIEDSDQSTVKLITTYTDPTLEGLRSKLDEIHECRRVVSTSFHGLLLAEAYKIPCFYYDYHKPKGVYTVDLEDKDLRIDWRIRDWFLGTHHCQMIFFSQPRNKQSDWDAVITAVDQHWEPLNIIMDDFLDAFPLSVFQDPRQPLKASFSLEAFNLF